MLIVDWLTRIVQGGHVNILCQLAQLWLRVGGDVCTVCEYAAINVQLRALPTGWHPYVNHTKKPCELKSATCIVTGDFTKDDRSIADLTKSVNNVIHRNSDIKRY